MSRIIAMIPAVPGFCVADSGLDRPGNHKPVIAWAAVHDEGEDDDAVMPVTLDNGSAPIVHSPIWPAWQDELRVVISCERHA